MAFDGVFLHKTICELKQACECHIDKIYQPSKDELVFLLRKKSFAKRLFISAKSGCARINFTENKYENPPTPPNFCMLLRKHLSSAKLIDIIQNGFERVVELRFSTTNELGDLAVVSLVCELIGNQANIILIKEDATIIDALKHSDIETAKRLIVPSAKYEYPPSQQKQNPLYCDFNQIAKEILTSSEPISNALLKRIDGFSPIVCREIEYNYEKYCLLKEDKLSALTKAYSDVKNHILNGEDCFILKDPSNKDIDYSYMPINQYAEEYKLQDFKSFSALMDSFYTAKDTAARISAASHNIVKIVNNAIFRTEKKLSLRLNELKLCENRETFRIYGELLKANLYSIKNGSKSAKVQNYYDENLTEIEIPLNPAISPAKNAEKYFKEYKKTYAAEQRLTVLTKQDKEEILYLNSVLDSISRSQTISELNEIAEELTESGYIKKTSKPKAKQNIQNPYKEYISSEGYKILVGKNNLQNDRLTTKLANKLDLWFHTKNIPGSHVVVFCGGKEVSEQTLLKAALLAAKNSKAYNSTNVPVDYTLIKNVKKPSGAKLGMVIYSTNKTIFVNPRECE